MKFFYIELIKSIGYCKKPLKLNWEFNLRFIENLYRSFTWLPPTPFLTDLSLKRFNWVKSLDMWILHNAINTMQNDCCDQNLTSTRRLVKTLFSMEMYNHIRRSTFEPDIRKLVMEALDKGVATYYLSVYQKLSECCQNEKEVSNGEIIPVESKFLSFIQLGFINC